MPLQNPSDQSLVLDEVDGLDGEAMRGTDSAALATSLSDVKDVVDAIPTTAMRGTDNAALASNYTAARAGYLDELAAANLPSDVDKLIRESAHVSAIFPEDSDETVTFVAGGVANTFGAWAEIVDNNAVTLSSKAATANLNISSLQVETIDTDDKIYVLEIAYGDAKTINCRSRLYSGTKFITAKAQSRFRVPEIPAGETIYYRMKCETLSAELTVSLRYHMHG